MTSPLILGSIPLSPIVAKRVQWTWIAQWIVAREYRNSIPQAALLREKIQNREAILNFFEFVTLMLPKMSKNYPRKRNFAQFCAGTRMQT